MSTTDSIQTIFLDLGNVLIWYDPMPAIRYFSKYTSVPAGEIFPIIKKAGLPELYEEGRITTEEFFEGIRKLTGCRLTLDNFQVIWEDMFSVNPFMEKMVKKLKGSYPLILLSNTNDMHFPYIRNKFPLIRLMDELVLSYKIGFVKPKKEIYLAALDVACAEPDRCLFIDDMEENIRGAQGVGIKTIHYTTDEEVARGLADFGIEIT